MGFDFARAIAIFGMVTVNFKIVMSAEEGNQVLLWFSGFFEGRASALFVVLAGIGLTFLTSKARLSGDQVLIRKNQFSVVKRGLLLIAIGLAYTPIWEADILHFYGFYFMIGAVVFTLSNRKLLSVGVFFMLLFPIMMLIIDYERGWNWDTLTYQNFWSVDGMIRHIFFNGFHPVIPWCAFLILGMWLGRLDLQNLKLRNKLIGIFFTIWVTIEGVSFLLRYLFENLLNSGMTTEEIGFLFSTSIIPPLPQYILAAGSLAVLVVLLSLYLTERFSQSVFVNWLFKTGQLSLSLYVAHVIIGMGTLEGLGRLENQTIEFSLLSTLLFCIFAIAFSVVWLKFFKSGPLEWLFRRIAS
jgi:uncharacterized membrane protein YeiB